jgi:hypothetical protein
MLSNDAAKSISGPPLTNHCWRILARSVLDAVEPWLVRISAHLSHIHQPHYREPDQSTLILLGCGTSVHIRDGLFVAMWRCTPN